MTPTEKESLMLASSNFLSKELPKNFDKWSEKKVNDYCQNNAWEPFQYYEGSEIYEHIDRLSDDQVFDILIRWSFADYLWDWLSDSCSEFVD